MNIKIYLLRINANPEDAQAIYVFVRTCYFSSVKRFHNTLPFFCRLTKITFLRRLLRSPSRQKSDCEFPSVLCDEWPVNIFLRLFSHFCATKNVVGDVLRPFSRTFALFGVLASLVCARCLFCCFRSPCRHFCTSSSRFIESGRVFRREERVN